MSIGDKHTFVGSFFEEVGHRILGGDLSRNDDGDISLWRTETCVEVKSSGHQSSYGFRLNVEQIEKYEQISLFPFSRAWYMLFAYRNKRKVVNGKRATELSVHETPSGINGYLASSVMWCTVVDLSIVSKWKEILPHSTKSVMGHRGLRTVNLKTKEIDELTNGGFDESLLRLGLDPRDFNRVSGKIKSKIQIDLFNQYEICIPITAILPKNESLSFQRMLKRRGFKINKMAS